MLFLNDEALGRRRSLTGVVDAAEHSPLHGGIKVGIVQDDEWIAPAVSIVLFFVPARLGSDPAAPAASLPVKATPPLIRLSAMTWQTVHWL